MNKNLRTALALAIFACASLISHSPARAQSVYGSIFGTVSDSTGAAVSGATVTVRDEAKGTVVTAISNASGDYSVPHLIPDVYDVKVNAKGFKSLKPRESMSRRILHPVSILRCRLAVAPKRLKSTRISSQS
jgi:hypothetical protein